MEKNHNYKFLLVLLTYFKTEDLMCHLGKIGIYRRNNYFFFFFDSEAELGVLILSSLRFEPDGGIEATVCLSYITITCAIHIRL